MKWKQLVLVAVAIAIGGCATQRHTGRWTARAYVTHVGAAPLEPPPPGKALMVFIKPSDYESVQSGLGPADYPRLLAGRPSLWRPNRADTVVDEAGRYLGDILPMSHFAAVVEPGRHLFTTVFIPDGFSAHQVRVLEADLAAGKSYFVEVGSGEAFDLLAIKPGASSWSKREVWLSATAPLSADTAAGETQLREFSDYAAWSVARAKENLARLNGEARSRHQLAPSDGL